MFSMLLPSKATPYSESTLAKMPLFIKTIKDGAVNVVELYEVMKRYTDNIGEFFEVLDSLYALRKIDYDTARGEIILC